MSASGPASSNTRWARVAVIDGYPVVGVRITEADGIITAVETGVVPAPGDERFGVVFPGFGNAHSHVFHRLLRGRTHGDGGDFWVWRDAMYRAAARLEPPRLREVATAVFTEMVAAGYTAVGEFHYVHHRADGSRYPDHEMELAFAEAAVNVGIRLTLLDTCYLSSGFGAPVSRAQRRFSDGTARAWLDRWRAVRDRLPDSPLVTLGAALHSVRAVPRDGIELVAAELPEGVPLHVHVSEQPRENADCLAAYGMTPTQLLAETGLLARGGASLVHATHLTEDDIALIGSAGATVVFCPTTEADLGDGIGPARELADAGAILAIGSDQNAVIDPLLELRSLEAHERLRSGSRGRFTPRALTLAGTSGGYRALGLDARGIAVGAPCDLVELADDSVRTAGSFPAQLPLTATASDVTRVVIGGRTVARDGLVEVAGRGLTDPADLLRTALRD